MTKAKPSKATRKPKAPTLPKVDLKAIAASLERVPVVTSATVSLRSLNPFMR